LNFQTWIDQFTPTASPLNITAYDTNPLRHFISGIISIRAPPNDSAVSNIQYYDLLWCNSTVNVLGCERIGITVYASNRLEYNTTVNNLQSEFNYYHVSNAGIVSTIQKLLDHRIYFPLFQYSFPSILIAFLPVPALKRVLGVRAVRGTCEVTAVVGTLTPFDQVCGDGIITSSEQCDGRTAKVLLYNNIIN
jgi:hypothetical protein